MSNHAKQDMIDEAINAAARGDSVELVLRSGDRFTGFSQLGQANADVYRLVTQGNVKLTPGSGSVAVTQPQTEAWFHLDDLVSVSFS